MEVTMEDGWVGMEVSTTTIRSITTNSSNSTSTNLNLNNTMVTINTSQRTCTCHNLHITISIILIMVFPVLEDLPLDRTVLLVPTPRLIWPKSTTLVISSDLSLPSLQIVFFNNNINHSPQYRM